MVTDGPPTGTPEPSRTLAPAARRLWQLEGTLTAVVALFAAGILQSSVGGTIALLGWIAAARACAVAVVVVPELRWRRWRWEVREHEIDIRRGTLRVRRTLVPMPRVQHVDTTRGGLEQALGLATVQVHTAAGGHTIPLLSDADADRVRRRIADLARTDDA